MATVTLDQTLDTLKQQVIDYVRLQLGDGIIDLELDAAHYESAYQRAVGVYRQRAEHAFEESYNFLKLQDELTSTENQILTARTRFNESVKKYNSHIKIFPNNLFAGIFGFKEKAFFEAVAGAEKPVDVEFDFGN